MTLNAQQYADAVKGARLFANADSSDPFTFQRTLAHINNGVVGLANDGSFAMYEAEPALEERKDAYGRPYTVTVYRNIKRP